MNYVWAFKILRGKYQEPEGAPKIRIMNQLDETERIIFRELGVGVRNAEGVWDRFGGQEETLKAWADI